MKTQETTGEKSRKPRLECCPQWDAVATAALANSGLVQGENGSLCWDLSTVEEKVSGVPAADVGGMDFEVRFCPFCGHDVDQRKRG